MVRRRILIPEGLKCKECGSDILIGAGTDWHANPCGDNPPRVLAQKYKCKKCGLIFFGGDENK